MKKKLVTKFQTFLKEMKQFLNSYFKGEIKIPLWIKILIFIGILLITLIAGMIVGYGVIGDGKKLDALKPSTWTHILDFMRK